MLTQSRNPEFAVNQVQESVNNHTTWLEKWKIAVSEDKTQTVVYTMRRAIKSDTIELNEYCIRWTNEACYLGIHTDAK